MSLRSTFSLHEEEEDTVRREEGVSVALCSRLSKGASVCTAGASGVCRAAVGQAVLPAVLQRLQGPRHHHLRGELPVFSNSIKVYQIWSPLCCWTLNSRCFSCSSATYQLWLPLATLVLLTFQQWMNRPAHAGGWRGGTGQTQPIRISFTEQL